MDEKKTTPVRFYGTGVFADKLFDFTPALLQHALCFVDRDEQKTHFRGRQVLRPASLKQTFPDAPIVILAAAGEEKIREELIRSLDLPETLFFPLDEYLKEYLCTEEPAIFPWRVRVDACTLCQLDCTDCYMRKHNYGTMGAGILDVQQFAAFLDGHPGIRYVELSNHGEPLLHPRMEALLKTACDRNVQVSFGNGTNLNIKDRRILEALVRYRTQTVNVAIDGTSQDVYEKYRRGGRLDLVLQNIRYINRLKELYHTPYPKLEWQFVVMDHNRHQAREAQRMAQELGMELVFRPNWQDAPQAEDLADGSGPAGEGSAGGRAEDARTGIAVPTDTVYNSELCAQMLFSPQVNWDGRLLGCCSVYQQDFGVNVFETGLRNAMGTPVYRAAWRALLTGNNMPPEAPCAACRVWQMYQRKGLAMPFSVPRV